MGKIFITVLMILVFIPVELYSQCGTTNHAGADWIVSASDTAGGTHTNIGKFEVAIGVTLSVDHACKFLSIEADTILIYGTIDGDGKGDAGGTGGAGGTYANGSAVPGSGGFEGLAGYGIGGGIVGAAGGTGGYIEQICGGFVCSGNQ